MFFTTENQSHSLPLLQYSIVHTGQQRGHYTQEQILVDRSHWRLAWRLATTGSKASTLSIYLKSTTNIKIKLQGKCYEDKDFFSTCCVYTFRYYLTQYTLNKDLYNECLCKTKNQGNFFFKCLGKHYKHSIFLVSIKVDKCLAYVICGAYHSINMKH